MRGLGPLTWTIYLGVDTKNFQNINFLECKLISPLLKLCENFEKINLNKKITLSLQKAAINEFYQVVGYHNKCWKIN